MKKIRRLILLNQMAGQLFRELAEGLAPHYLDGCLLLTGHPDTLKMKGHLPENLKVESAPGYDRRTMTRRAFSWLKYLFVTTRLILGAKKSDGFLIVSNPPILGGWFWLLNKLHRRPYAVLVYDIYPDILVMMGVITENNPIVKVWHWMNRKVYRDAVAVITLGRHMAARLTRNYPFGKKWLYVIPPWVDVEQIKPMSYGENPLLKSFNPDGKKVILYSGNMGLSHEIDSMLEAAKLLRGRKDLLFLFIGGGEKWQLAADFSKRHNLSDVKVHPFQPEKLLPMTMSLATISLVALEVGAEELMVPSKLFYYMAAGSAVVGICQGENELRDIIDDNEIGLCVHPGDPEALAKTIGGLLDDKSQLEKFKMNARYIAETQYSRNIGVNVFVSVLSKIEVLIDE
jgi:glycosyltransferase involved in cell wall biosynthesis